MFGVWCVVSGGVTGHREAWLKDAGRLKVFSDRASAAIEAGRLNRNMNHPRAKAAFHYEPRELPADYDLIAKAIAGKIGA